MGHRRRGQGSPCLSGRGFFSWPSQLIDRDLKVGSRGSGVAFHGPHLNPPVILESPRASVSSTSGPTEVVTCRRESEGGRGHGSKILRRNQYLESRSRFLRIRTRVSCHGSQSLGVVSRVGGTTSLPVYSRVSRLTGFQCFT